MSRELLRKRCLAPAGSGWALAGPWLGPGWAHGGGGSHGSTWRVCARPGGRHPVSVRCHAACKSTSVPTNPITSTKDNERHQNKGLLNDGSQIKSGAQTKALWGVLLQTSSLYSRVTTSVRPHPTVLLKTTTPTTKPLISFSCFSRGTEFHSWKDL